ncbi:MAG: FAD-dependent oxidoreductase [Pseudomonadota bacterium]
MNIQAQPTSVETSVDAADGPVVVVGGGPVGMRMAQELCRLGRHVVLFNAERWQPYNRVKLTPLLAGEAQLGSVHLSDYVPRPGRLDRYDGVSVVDIDRAGKAVTTSTGRRQPYATLVLAIGSRAFVPEVPGADLPGVFTFRDFNDVEALLARSMTARKVLVIGGGLLGLEAARGMAKRGAAVSVVEHENRLMPRQLDDGAAAILKARIEDLGTEVLTGQRVARIVGEGRVDCVELADGTRIPSDTVIFCTGVRANTQLAIASDLRHNRGIQVDAQLRSSDPDIFAVGECAEFDGRVIGLVGPGFEQVSVAADAIAGSGAARYAGSTPATKLKVLGAEVFSMGDYETLEQQTAVRSVVWEDPETGAYRRLLIRRGRLVAALGVGDWPEANRLQQAVNEGARVTAWHRWTFQRHGRVWREDTAGVSAWPGTAIVCNCTGVTKGAIADAVTLGAGSLDEVRAATSANTVCGTCKPLVLDLLGQGNAAPEPVRWWRWLIGLSGIAGVMALATLVLPRVPVPDTFRIGDLWTNLWFDGVWKQWSGYILLGLTAAAAVLGLRRRIKIFSRLGGYESWRLVHLAIGVAAVIGLFVHTGFRLGSGLNFWLMAAFAATLLFGAILGLTTGGGHKLVEQGLDTPEQKARTLPYWVHVIALWPLPVLLLAHILSVYSY